ncbi:MAG: hypothetical protein MR373_05550 [Faecalibacterium prausnitzii]|nr:hypothetical protein [Faecalibacterium prausnitzii]MDD7152844.1 hypothetical protein [Faecalibacterium prausnitzii]
MDHKYQSTMLLPASYAVLSEEEMTYVDGGAFKINITPQQVGNIALNITVNALMLLGKGVFEQGLNIVQGGLDDGLTLDGIAVHFWNKMNGWSKAATIGLGALGGVYLYGQAVSIVKSLRNLYDSIVNPMPDMPVPGAQSTQAAAA